MQTLKKTKTLFLLRFKYPAKQYADLLLPLGYGYPLWRPEGPDNCVDYVQLGDVGYIHPAFGAFIRLFNMTVDAQHEWNKEGVPDGFRPIHISKEDIVRHERFLFPRPLCRRDVQISGMNPDVL